jgi:dolichol-phosphate mannosyltransferase
VAEPTSPPIESVAVIMPTYEERQNLEAIAGRLRAAVPHADLLVVVENSPDGTVEMADKMFDSE